MMIGYKFFDELGDLIAAYACAAEVFIVPRIGESVFLRRRLFRVVDVVHYYDAIDYDAVDSDRKTINHSHEVHIRVERT